MVMYGGHTAALTYGFGCCMIQHTATFPIQQPYSIQQPRPSLWLSAAAALPPKSSLTPLELREARREEAEVLRRGRRVRR